MFYAGSLIIVDSLSSKSQASVAGNKYLTKIEIEGKLNVHHRYNALLPLETEK